MKKKSCKHQFANFKITCEGEEDCIVAKCVHCGEEKDFFWEKVQNRLDRYFASKIEEVLANQNVINTEKYYLDNLE